MSFLITQVKITTASTAVQLPNNTYANGFTIKASIANSSTGVFIGSSSVNTTDDGTGNGFKLNPGDQATITITNSNLLYAISQTAGDFIYIEGN